MRCVPADRRSLPPPAPTPRAHPPPRIRRGVCGSLCRKPRPPQRGRRGSPPGSSGLTADFTIPLFLSTLNSVSKSLTLLQCGILRIVNFNVVLLPNLWHVGRHKISGPILQIHPTSFRSTIQISSRHLRLIFKQACYQFLIWVAQADMLGMSFFKHNHCFTRSVVLNLLCFSSWNLIGSKPEPLHVKI